MYLQIYNTRGVITAFFAVFRTSPNHQFFFLIHGNISTVSNDFVGLFKL